MTLSSRREALLLFLGDIVIFALSLWFVLLLRYQGTPDPTLFFLHIQPFSILFIVWVIVFFTAGLYEKHTTLFRRRLPSVVFTAQGINAVLAVMFFYFVPFFGIAPKTNLFLYLLVSFPLILAWRSLAPSLWGAGRKEQAILVGSGEEMRELRDEVNGNSQYRFRFISTIDLDKIEGLDFNKDIAERVYTEEVSLIVVDLRNTKVEPMLPHLYNLIYSNVRFVDANRLYEDIFNRVPISLLEYNWFLENISQAPHAAYDTAKRIMDLVVGGVLFLLSLPFYPVVWFLLKIQDGGPVFIFQERIGQNNVPMRLVKFRSMTGNDSGQYGEEGKTKLSVTRVGRFLRSSRIDELPQLWNVFRGDLSLIGPRPELPSLVKLYEGQIPYYNIRHLIKPGLSGWAQLYHETHPHHGVAVSETKEKLSYDLYYIKNHSLILDLSIAVKTVKTLLLRKGR